MDLAHCKMEYAIQQQIMRAEKAEEVCWRWDEEGARGEWLEKECCGIWLVTGGIIIDNEPWHQWCCQWQPISCFKRWRTSRSPCRRGEREEEEEASHIEWSGSSGVPEWSYDVVTECRTFCSKH